MPNRINLDKVNSDPERKSEICRAAAKKANERIKAKKKMKEEMLAILSLPVKNNIRNKANKLINVDKVKALDDFKGMNTTVQTQVLLKVTQMAMSGNLKAIEFITSLIGENKQVVDLTTTAKVTLSKADTLAEDLFGDSD